MLNIFQNSYRRIFNVHFAVQGPYTMNHSLPLFLICFLHKSFPKWCKVFVDDDFLFLPRLELQWRHLTKFQILKCFLNLFSSCKVLIWSCHYIINFTIIAVSHLHYLFIYLFIYQHFWTQPCPEGMCTNGTQVLCEVPSLSNPTTRKG